MRNCLFIACVIFCSCGGQANVDSISGDHSLASLPASEAESKTELNQSSTMAVQPRKVIFRSSIKLTVEDFDSIDSNIRNFALAHQGYISNSEVEGQNRTPRQGKWTVRVPVATFDSFLESIKNLGKLTLSKQEATNVTAEYVDLESRITNTKKLEARILELLKRMHEDLDEVIKIEHEVARIREKIEVMEGRLRMLKDLTGMTTVSISVTEIENAKLSTVVPAAFAKRVSIAWKSSVDRARTIAEDFIVWFVANAISMAFLTLVIGVAWLLGKHIYKRMVPATTPRRVAN